MTYLKKWAGKLPERSKSSMLSIKPIMSSEAFQSRFYYETLKNSNFFIALPPQSRVHCPRRSVYCRDERKRVSQVCTERNHGVFCLYSASNFYCLIRYNPSLKDVKCEQGLISTA